MYTVTITGILDLLYRILLCIFFHESILELEIFTILLFLHFWIRFLVNT